MMFPFPTPASVVIDNFNIPCPKGRPLKTDPKLLIDPNRVLSAPIPSKGFQSVSRRNSQCLQILAPMDQIHLSPCCIPKFAGATRPRLPRNLTVIKVFRSFVGKRQDHAYSIARHPCYDKSIVPKTKNLSPRERREANSSNRPYLALAAPFGRESRSLMRAALPCRSRM